ncbi:hypothetical protein OQA88_11615 [Cercophora sp. LCS_1]
MTSSPNGPNPAEDGSASASDSTFPIPIDALRIIADQLETPRAAANFARLTRTAHSLSKDHTWDLDTRLPGPPALYRALSAGDVTLFGRALAHYKQNKLTGLLDGTSVNWTTFHPRKRGRYVPDPKIYSLSLFTPPIILAVEARELEMLQMLIDAGVSLHATRIRPTVHLDPAVAHGSYYHRPLPTQLRYFRNQWPRCVCRCVRGHGGIFGPDHSWSECDPASTETCRETALHLAVDTYQVEMARKLCRAGAGADNFTGSQEVVVHRLDQDAPHGRAAPPLLHRALGARYYGDKWVLPKTVSATRKERVYDVVEMLLEMGANPNEFHGHYSENSVLAQALKIDARKVAKLLVEHGAVVDLPDYRGYFHDVNGPDKAVELVDFALGLGERTSSQDMLDDLLTDAAQGAGFFADARATWEGTSVPPDTYNAVILHLLEKGARWRSDEDIEASIWGAWKPAEYVEKLRRMGCSWGGTDDAVERAERDIEHILVLNRQHAIEAGILAR